MDFTKALVCAALAYVLTDQIKRSIPAKLPAVVVQLIALAVGVGTIFLVGSTVWAHTQVIGGHTLDSLNTGSKIVAGIIVGGGSTIFDRFNLFDSRSQDSDKNPPPAPAP